jgi:hypothetical protein
LKHIECIPLGIEIVLAGIIPIACSLPEYLTRNVV